jgi:hypothetical protein
LFLFYFVWKSSKLSQKSSERELIYSSLPDKILYLFGVAFTLIGGYWFLILLLKYGKPVIYSFNAQFSELPGYGSEFLDQLKTLLNIVLNYDGSVIYFSLTHTLLLGTSLIAYAWLEKRKQGVDYKTLKIYSLALFLALILPLVINKGQHWKSYYTFLTLLYLGVPLLLLSIWPKKLNKIIGVISSIVLSMIVLTDLPLLPGADRDDMLRNDLILRDKVNQLNKKHPGKLLILRGGEPGGDWHSHTKFYYWENEFLFGDIDKYFKRKNSPQINEIACIFKAREISLIIDPTTANIPNHSGKLAHDRVKALLKGNSDYFSLLLKRDDAYKGELYLFKPSSLEC